MATQTKNSRTTKINGWVMYNKVTGEIAAFANSRDNAEMIRESYASPEEITYPRRASFSVTAS